MAFISRVQTRRESAAQERSLVAVAAALNDQAQLVFPGEVDGGDDVGGLSGGHRIDARPGCPAIRPSLMSASVPHDHRCSTGFAATLKTSWHAGLSGASRHALRANSPGSIAPRPRDRAWSSFPRKAKWHRQAGHGKKLGSKCRVRPERSASRNHSMRDSRGIDAAALSNCLLFMEWSFQFVFGTSSTSASSTTGFYTDRPQTAAVQKRPPHQ